MPKRPWIKADDIRAYTSLDEVKKRDDNKLKTDIFMAEEYIIRHTQNDFSDFEVLPEKVKTACILLADSYARKAIIMANPYEKERFDEYSYEVNKKGQGIDLLEIKGLLQDYLPPGKACKIGLRKL